MYWCILVGEDNSSADVYNKNNFTYTNRYYSITIQKNPNSKFQNFHNTGQITASNTGLIIDMPDVDFYLDGGIYKTTDAILTLNGKDFYSNGGIFEVGNSMTLNFGDFINVSETKITGNSVMTINLTGRFSNDSTLAITGEKDQRLNLYIEGGDFYNGIDHSSGQEFFSGNIVLNNTFLNIKKNLISEGVDKDNPSKIIINEGGFVTISGNLTNGPYSNIFLADSLARISATNITNKSEGEMHLKGHLIASGDFISQAGSRLYFSGTDYSAIGVYGAIQAKNINIKGASVYFSKGSALANTSYYFLTATTGTLSYDSSLLGTKDVLSDDGTLNQFYEAVIEKSDDTKNSLQVTFKKKKFDVSDESEKTIIDMFSKENPIPGFDIKNLSLNQIRTISKNINDGLQSYAHSKDTALSTGFEAIKTNLFARMIGGGSSPSVSHRSAILPYTPSVHYVANTSKSNYPTTKASDYTQSDVIAYPPITKPKDNNLYVNLLGAFQTSSGGYGYGYGLSVGYDKNFDDKLFVGVYLAYIGGGMNLDMLSSQTQGFEAGVYARFKTSIFETDMILNQGYAYNKTHKNITILSDTYSTYSYYGTQSYDLLLQSGPRFDFGKNTIKPYIGLNINLNTGGDIDEDAQAFASSYHFKDNLYLSESIGIEYKRLFKQGYFFIRPSYEANIWSNASETQVLFLNNTISIAIPPKEMFGSVLLGGEVAINDSLLFNLNASAKASNQKTFIATGMASLKYVF